MIDKDLLGIFSRDLGSKSRIVGADIRDMAWCWELVVDATQATSPASIQEILMAITRAYLRGRERRMGNWQGYRRHRNTMSFLIFLIVECVVEEPFFYEALHKAGVTSQEGYLSMQRQATEKALDSKGDILEEAERILKSKDGRDTPA